MAEKQNKETRKYKLVHDYEEQHKYFKDIYTYMPKLMEFLWEQPKIVAKLLSLSKIEDVKKNLAPFFANNFYENILSSVYIEDNLMYMISLLLIDEIKGIDKIEDNKFLDEIKGIDKIEDNKFLDETAGGYVLEQLKNKTDVQIYFKTIMLSLVEKLETMSSSKKINFNVKQIEEDFLKAKELMDLKFQKTGTKQKVIDRNFFRCNKRYKRKRII